jgi:hypothetical protein
MNKRALRTFFTWLVWAATAAAVSVGLYRDAAVWEFIKHDPSHITQLILVTFFLGVMASFVLVVLLTKEFYRVIIVQANVAKGGLRELPPAILRRAVDRFFRDLKTTIDVNGEPDVEVLLHTELATYHRISHSIEVTGNLMITFGLIGTVLGLSITLSGLSTSLEALGHDQVMLLEGLRKAMSGMGTAFYTTLLGAVMGGVLLRIFAQITDNGVDRLHHAVMRICLIYCSADYKPSMRRDLQVLNAELELLHRNAQSLEVAFRATRDAMEYLQGKVVEYGTEDADKPHPLSVAIERHRRYTEVLRQEVHLLAELEQSWLARFLSLFGVYPRRK